MSLIFPNILWIYHFKDTDFFSIIFYLPLTKTFQGISRQEIENLLIWKDFWLSLQVLKQPIYAWAGPAPSIQCASSEPGKSSTYMYEYYEINENLYWCSNTFSCINKTSEMQTSLFVNIYVKKNGINFIFYNADVINWLGSW